jgi:hypothetical protein
MTWADYNRFAYGKLKRDTTAWEHTRSIISMIYNSNVTKKNDQRTPDKILPLWTDKIGKPKKPIGEPISEEQAEGLIKKIQING